MARPRAIVIGSGFGGLTLAVRLQASGFATTLLEKRDQPGGRAYVFRDNGFVFDAGPTVITAPHCLSEVFAEAGVDMQDYVKLLPVKPFYRLQWHDGEYFDYDNDENKLRSQIEKRNPKDWEGYKRFYDYSHEVFDEGYARLAHVPFLDFWSMLKVAPQLVKLQAHRSVYSMVSKYIEDERLREAFSFHSLLVGGNPFSSSAIYTLIHFLERNWGVYFPKGGTGALVQALVRLFEELGGELLLNAEVQRILVKNQKACGVELSSGTLLTSDIVVSNADVTTTYSKLLNEEPLAQKTATKLLGSRHSMSLFLVYFGTRKKYPEVSHHTVLFGPRYRGLLADIFKRGKLAEDFSLYLHAPTVSDPSLAPEGCEGFYVLSPVPNLGRTKIDWKTVGPKYADSILASLESQLLPDLRANIVTKRIFTPEDFASDLGAHLGNAFSLEPLLTQSAYFRVHNRDDKIGGLYFVGAGTHPGAGVPGVVNSAKATHRIIMDDFCLHGGLIRQFPNRQFATQPDLQI